MGGEKMSFLQLVNITKRFGKTMAVDNVSLGIDKGEFIVLLGPSGCGKTTTLRIIAGLELPDSGKVVMEGRDVTYLEPGERNVGMVFQDYALYPHMTVFENIAFPLDVNKRKLGLSKKDIEERVLSVARMLGLEELLDRKVTQLSGGQQQRVALARALVKEPKIWLMDEPLSNIDALLRVQVRAELKKLQMNLGITTVYVTHDQVEALTLADRVAVMNKGRVVQVGAPREIYENPSHVFVATFVGSPPMNIMECKALQDRVECPGFSIKMPEEARVLRGETRVYLGIRPEHIEVFDKPVTGAIEGRLFLKETLGSEQLIYIQLGDVVLKARTAKELAVGIGEPIFLKLNMTKALVFDRETGELLQELSEHVKAAYL